MDRNKKAQLEYFSLLHKKRDKNLVFESVKKCILSQKGEGENEKNYFFWEYDVKPTPLGDTYRVLIIYHVQKNKPYVYILSNNIHHLPRDRRRSIPHLYDSEKIKLCLHHPSYDEWSPEMDFCETIISWTYLWLYYYEAWLYSGEWKGGGEHPSVPKEEDKIIESKKEKKSKKQIKNEKSVAIEIDRIYKERRKIYLTEMRT